MMKVNVWEVIYRTVINTITAIMAVLFIVTGCCLDSESDIPLIICAVSVVWLLIMTWKAVRDER